MLWKEVSEGISAFFQDLKEHGTGENVVMYLFSEFGRRVHDNGSGTDHGAAGVRPSTSGTRCREACYGEYPSRKNEDLEQGDLVPNYDFRGGYKHHRGRLVRTGRQPDSGRQLREAVGLEVDSTSWEASAGGTPQSLRSSVTQNVMSKQEED